MVVVELFVKDGHLWYHGLEEWMGEKDRIVLVRYPEGDCDVFCWPLKEVNKQKIDIAHAMYDARETGDIPSDTGVICLPDGSTIDL